MDLYGDRVIVSLKLQSSVIYLNEKTLRSSLLLREGYSFGLGCNNRWSRRKKIGFGVGLIGVDVGIFGVEVVKASFG